MKTTQNYFYLIIFFILSGCTNEPAPPPIANTNSCATSSDEIAECSTSTVYASPVNILGNSQFYKRKIRVLGNPDISALTLGAPISTALPIKFAEVRVTNAAGTIVQCGVTDANGAIKALDGTSPLQISNTAGNYNIEILSRTNHTLSVGGGKPDFKIYTSIKKDICTNTLHRVSKTITSSGSGSVTLASTDLTAYSRESESSNDIQGGAFNILNDIITTYEYLSTNTGTSDLSCLSTKFHTYWQAGFNPAQYIYPDSNPATLGNISFYLRGYNELYVNGGKLGNVTTADTDHFDDSVIIHEIGHRIEDACGKMDSPGGSHNGLFRIDPRLAWSEGWGNYFGAHIFRNMISNINPQVNTDLTAYDGWLYYLDTEGYSDGASGTASELIRFNLKKLGNNPESAGSGYYFDKVDPVTNPGEGHFREVSIARSLFKISNTCTASNCTGLGPTYFPKIWQAFEKNPAGVGMGKSTYAFRSSPLFYNRMVAAFGGSMPAGIDTILNTDEAQQQHDSLDYTLGGNLTWPAYGIKLVPSLSVCNLEIRPRNEEATVTNGAADQRYSNHFYLIDKATSLPGITQINITSNYAAGTTNINIGLRLYSESYKFESSIAQYNTSYLDVTNLSPNTPYLLNIRAYTAGVSISDTTRYTYRLTTNNPGEYLCPTSTY